MEAKQEPCKGCSRCMVTSLIANVDIAGSPKCWHLYIFMMQHDDHGNLNIFEGQISDTERRPRPHCTPESRSLGLCILKHQVSAWTASMTPVPLL